MASLLVGNACLPPGRLDFVVLKMVGAWVFIAEGRVPLLRHIARFCERTAYKDGLPRVGRVVVGCSQHHGFLSLQENQSLSGGEGSPGDPSR